MSNKNSKPDFDNQRYHRIEVGADKKFGFREADDRKFKIDPNGQTVRLPQFDPPAFNFSATDGIANQAQAVISLKHMPSGQEEYFKAFITTFSDTLAPSYNEETVFGRTDAIYTFRNTTRNISLNWKIPAESYSEAYENLAKVQNIAKYVYPSYHSLNESSTFDNALTLSQTPLVRLKVMNLLTKTKTAGGSSKVIDDTNPESKFTTYRSDVSANQGALGVIKSMTILHNLENVDNGGGVLYAGPNTVLPKLIEVNISFDVIHDETLGWQGRNFNNRASGFPYDVVKQKEIDLEQLNNANTHNQAIAARQAEVNGEQLAQQAKDNAIARYGTAGGNARFKKDQKRIYRLANKENLNDRQREKLKYLSSTVAGQQALNQEDNNSIWDDPQMLDS
mgnify:CR=1 FL=1